MSPDQADIRRQEATRAAIRYFLLAFVVVGVMSATAAYAVISARAQARESHSIRLAYCQELEKIKADNRADVERDRRNYARNLRLLGIKDTPELRRAAQQEWSRRLARNAPKSCPYTGNE